MLHLRTRTVTSASTGLCIGDNLHGHTVRLHHPSRSPTRFCQHLVLDVNPINKSLSRGHPSVIWSGGTKVGSKSYFSSSGLTMAPIPVGGQLKLGSCDLMLMWLCALERQRGNMKISLFWCLLSENEQEELIWQHPPPPPSWRALSSPSVTRTLDMCEGLQNFYLNLKGIKPTCGRCQCNQCRTLKSV